MNQLMLALISHEIEGKLVHQRATDGYVNATAMCNAVGKLFADYRRLKATDEFLKELSSDMGIPISQLVLSFKGNTTQYQQGTWVHPDVAINLAQWLSPKFAVAVSRWVRDWMAGKVKKGALPYHIERYMANRQEIPPTHFSMLNEMIFALVAPLESDGYRLHGNAWLHQRKVRRAAERLVTLLDRGELDVAGHHVAVTTTAARLQA